MWNVLISLTFSPVHFCTRLLYEHVCCELHKYIGIYLGVIGVTHMCPYHPWESIVTHSCAPLLLQVKWWLTCMLWPACPEWWRTHGLCSSSSQQQVDKVEWWCWWPQCVPGCLFHSKKQTIKQLVHLLYTQEPKIIKIEYFFDPSRGNYFFTEVFTFVGPKYNHTHTHRAHRHTVQMRRDGGCIDGQPLNGTLGAVRGLVPSVPWQCPGGELAPNSSYQSTFYALVHTGLKPAFSSNFTSTPVSEKVIFLNTTKCLSAWDGDTLMGIFHPWAVGGIRWRRRMIEDKSLSHPVHRNKIAKCYMIAQWFYNLKTPFL